MQRKAESRSAQTSDARPSVGDGARARLRGCAAARSDGDGDSGADGANRCTYADANPAYRDAYCNSYADTHSADRRATNGDADANPAYRDAHANARAKRLHRRDIRPAAKADARLQPQGERDGRGVDGGAASQNAA